MSGASFLKGKEMLGHSFVCSFVVGGRGGGMAAHIHYPRLYPYRLKFKCLFLFIN
jgi:hypothetical protein